MNKPPSEICGHAFTWPDSVIPSGTLKHSKGQITGIDFDRTHAGNQVCIRGTAQGYDKCIWHSEAAIPEDANKDGVVYDAKLSELKDLDLSSMVLPYAKFEGTIENVCLTNTILVGSDFQTCELIDVNFQRANLQNSVFTDSEARQGAAMEGVLFKGSMCEGVDFRGLEFYSADFTEASFNHQTDIEAGQTFDSISFRRANLTDVDFSEVILPDCSFEGANLRGADFSEARLSGADLRRTKCIGTDFVESELENSNFSAANLEGASFRHAEFHSAVFTDAQIDYNTEFDEISVYETEEESDNKFEDKPTRVLKALWTYRTLQKLTRENALLDRTRNYYIREKELRRKQHWFEIRNSPDTNVLSPFNGESSWKYRMKILSKIIRAEGSRYIIEYGENPWQIIKSAIVVITLSSLLYPLFGLTDGNDTIQYFFVSGSGISYSVDKTIDTILFSTFAFIRVGFSPYQPVGGSEIIAAFQGVLGAIFIALLVFVLGRRATY